MDEYKIIEVNKILLNKLYNGSKLNKKELEIRIRNKKKKKEKEIKCSKHN